MKMSSRENFEIPVPKVETLPAWQYPDKPLFIEWYLDQSSKPEGNQSQEFKEFLMKVEAGEANLPTDEALARYKIDELRHRKSRE